VVSTRKRQVYAADATVMRARRLPALLSRPVVHIQSQLVFAVWSLLSRRDENGWSSVMHPGRCF